MPFPLVAIIPVLVAWGTRAAATYGLARMWSDEPMEELKRVVFGYVVEYAARYAGLNLDPDDPISDASFSSAVSERLGFTVRTLKDRASLEEDVEGYALMLIEQRSGYHLSSLRNVDMLKADMVRIALQILSEKTGIPFAVTTGELTPEAIKEQVLAWGKAQLLTSFGEEASTIAGEIIAAGGLEAVAADLNSRLSQAGSIEAITARQLAFKVAERMATGAVVQFGKVASGLDKKNRRKELNRAYQAKFKRIHGNRQKYVPLGPENANDWDN